MANFFANTQWVTLECADHLTNKLPITKLLNNSESKNFKQKFAVGSTIQAKLPQQFLDKDGPALQTQAVNRKTTPVTMDQWVQVSFEVTSGEVALNLERGAAAFRENYLVPAMNRMSQAIESRTVAYVTSRIPNVVGQLGVNASSPAIAGAARQRLKEMSCTTDDMTMVVTPASMTSVVDGTTTLFHDGQQISQAFRKGMITTARGFDWIESNSLRTHTAGNWGGAVTVAGAGQYGTSLLVNCTSGDTFKQGDVISIANVNAVNPATYQSLGRNAQFVITQDTTATGSTATIYIATNPDRDGIIGPGDQYQNVDSLPADTAALTLFPGTTLPNGKVGINNLAITRDAFMVVSVPISIPSPGGTVLASANTTDPKTGVSVSFMHVFDPVQMREFVRFDSLFGYGVGYANNCAVRYLSLT